MDISPTRDLFGTPIVKIWGLKSFLSNFSSKILFEKKSRFTAKRHILKKTFITTTPPIIAHLRTRDLLWTPIVNIFGWKSFISYFFSKMLIEIKKSRFTAKRRILEKNCIRTTPPFMAILPTRDLFATPIVHIPGWKSFISYFSLKMLFEIQKVVLRRNDVF